MACCRQVSKSSKEQLDVGKLREKDLESSACFLAVIPTSREGKKAVKEKSHKTLMFIGKS
jgi:hypothetical protein